MHNASWKAGYESGLEAHKKEIEALNKESDKLADLVAKKEGEIFDLLRKQKAMNERIDELMRDFKGEHQLYPSGYIKAQLKSLKGGDSG